MILTFETEIPGQCQEDTIKEILFNKWLEEKVFDCKITNIHLYDRYN